MKGDRMAHQAQRVCIGLLATQFFILPAAAEDNLATILSPAHGAKLKAEQVYTLEYDVKPESKAEHVHLYIDGDEAAIGHKLKGDFPLGPLKPGDRKICISPVNKNHTQIAAQTCITVMVQ
jgi:hypothetical protein